MTHTATLVQARCKQSMPAPPPLSMNLPGKPTAAASLPKSKAPDWTCKRSGSWSQGMLNRETGLPMNRLPLPLPRLRQLPCRFMVPAQGSIGSLLSTRSPLLLALLAILVLWKSAQPCAAAPPPGWTDADIGLPALAGSTLWSNGTWTISASGTDICSYDQLHFAWMPISGDSVISAKVTSIQTAAGQAGIMFRNDTTFGSVEAAVLVTASNGITFQWRSNPGVGCSYQIALGVGTNDVPVSLRLVRSGNSFSAFWSTNDVDFNQVGLTPTVPLNLIALAGLAVSANDNSTLCTATFNQVSTPAPVFGVYRELWPALNSSAGNNLAALTNTTLNPNWPNAPDPGYIDEIGRASCRERV